MKYLILSISVLLVSFLNGQNILNTSSPKALRALRDAGLTITSKGDTISSIQKPLQYGYIETADILWSKTVWEIIDLNEKVNQPLYYTSDGLTQKTNSLFQVLFDAVMSGKVKEVYNDEDFVDRLDPADKRNVFYLLGYLYTSKVKTFHKNGYGLYDMAGNVSEWTVSPYNNLSYQISSTINPYLGNKMNDPMKVVRGGSWKDVGYMLMVSFRDNEHQDSARSYIGFRCVQTIPESADLKLKRKSRLK